MNRSGLEKSITIIIVLVIGLAVALVVILMTSDNLKNFFTGSDDVNNENTDILHCDVLCFNCCMYTPKECSGVNALPDITDSGCNCKC